MMREKLLLLSRIPFSPPNLKVSGGLLLLHGGSLHHHGGSPLPRGGLSPTRLGVAVAVVSQLLLHRHIPTATANHPHQTLKPLSTVLSPPTPPTLSTPFRSVATTRPATNLSPPNHNSVIHFLLGNCSDSGVLLLPPRTTSMLMTAPPRPPPEPPPAKGNDVLVSSLDSKLFVLPMVLPPFKSLALFRPPPKPPWLFCVVHVFLAWVFWYGAPMGNQVHDLGFSLFWSKYAYQVFDKTPHRALGCLSTQLWTLLQFMAIVKTFGDDSFADDRTSCQLASLSHDKWFNLETIFSRMERTQVKDIIRNWIGRKTAESLTWITTSTWEMQLLVLWLFRRCLWVGYGLMDLKQSKCNGFNGHISCVVFSIIVVGPSLWFGNVQPHLLHVSCIDDLGII